MDHGKVHSEVYGLTSSWGDDEPPRNQVFYLKGLSLAMQVKVGEFGSFFFKAHLQSITTLRPDSTFFFCIFARPKALRTISPHVSKCVPGQVQLNGLTG